MPGEILGAKPLRSDRQAARSRDAKRTQERYRWGHRPQGIFQMTTSTHDRRRRSWVALALRAGAAMRLELAHVAIQFGGLVKLHAIGADAAPRGE